MKNLLKYLLPFIVAAAFAGGSAGSSSACDEEKVSGFSIDAATYTVSLSSAESDFCLPRQVSNVNTIRIQGSSRRTENVQRQGFEFIKSGKVINAGIRYFIQKNSIVTHSSHFVPAYRVISLGKLII